ncbi:MAG: ribonuclease R [Bacteroidetes bacterium]|nr:ribonuclease R [Bacteroidota bacterium]
MSNRSKITFPERVVLAVLENAGRGTYNVNQVFSRIPKEANFSKEMVHQALMKLANHRLVREPSNGNYSPIQPTVKSQGELVLSNRGDYYVRMELDGEMQQVYMDNEMVGKLLPGDLVTCEIRTKGNRTYVKSIGLLERVPQRYSAILDVFEKNAFGLIQKNGLKDIKITEVIDPKYDGHKAIIEVYDFPHNSRNPLGRVIAILGEVGQADTEMHAIVAEFGFNTRFPDAVIEESEAIPNEISPKDWGERLDMRDVFCITIDPADAKDFDDAISITKDKDGNHVLGVHIADVSHFVTPGSPIDKEAVLRGTSVYLVDRTIPMLPENLSNDLCSLKPHVDRLAFSVIFTLSPSFEIIKQWFGKTVINSKRRFAYEEAQEVIETGKGDHVEELRLLNRMAKHFESIRFANGALRFESKEIRFRFDENKRPIESYVKSRFDAHLLIETFMLMANEAVAKYVKTLKKPELPFIYRSHDLPPQDKLIEFARFCKLMGYPINIDNEAQMRKSFNELMERTANDPSAEILQQMAIRTMSKAVYTAFRSDHFGLAFEYYTHFTSPIRRYPDLLVHRLLQHYLTEPKPFISESEIEMIAKHSSNMEQKAAEAERASTKYTLALMMEQHIGKVMDATITGITEWGIYAMATEYHCEGLIRMSDVKGDRFTYYEAEKKLVGQRTKRSYHLGDPITVSVKKTDPQIRIIDFNLLD